MKKLILTLVLALLLGQSVFANLTLSIPPITGMQAGIANGASDDCLCSCEGATGPALLVSSEAACVEQCSFVGLKMEECIPFELQAGEGPTQDCSNQSQGVSTADGSLSVTVNPDGVVDPASGCTLADTINGMLDAGLIAEHVQAIQDGTILDPIVLINGMSPLVLPEAIITESGGSENVLLQVDNPGASSLTGEVTPYTIAGDGSVTEGTPQTVTVAPGAQEEMSFAFNCIDDDYCMIVLFGSGGATDGSIAYTFGSGYVTPPPVVVPDEDTTIVEDETVVGEDGEATVDPADTLIDPSLRDAINNVSPDFTELPKPDQDDAARLVNDLVDLSEEDKVDVVYTPPADLPPAVQDVPELDDGIFVISDPTLAGPAPRGGGGFFGGGPISFPKRSSLQFRSVTSVLNDQPDELRPILGVERKSRYIVRFGGNETELWDQALTGFHED